MPLYELGLGSEKVHVILDIGAYHTKVGFAGESAPRHIIRSQNIKRSDQVVDICDPKLTKDELYEELSTFVHTIYFRYLLVNPKDRKVVVCENFVQRDVFRFTLADVLFKQFSVVAVMMTPALPLALTPLGVSTGVVLNIGHTESSVIAVYEGMIIMKSFKYVDLGTVSHLAAIQEIIAKTGEVQVGENKKKASEIYGNLSMSQLEDIRARVCFCGERPPELEDTSYAESGSATKHRAVHMDYPMPDGHHLIIGGNIRERSVEVLYDGDGEDNSIATILLDALLECPLDCRTQLANSILVTGGGSMLAGFTHRLKQELLALLKLKRYSTLPLKTLKFFKPPYYPNIMTWVGGSVVGSVEHLHDRYTSKEHYLATGPASLPEWACLRPVLRESTPPTPLRRSSSHMRDYQPSPILGK